MAYLTMTTEDGEFHEFHTKDSDDARIKAWLLDRSVERALQGPSVDELREMLNTNPWDQSYEDYLSDEPDQHGIPDGLSREEYEAQKRIVHTV